jgi:hypothetical protein
MADEKIDIKELNKADVLAVLYNASKPQGMGFMHYDPTPMTREQAQELLDAGYTYFDYLRGRVMKIDLSGDQLNPLGYDMDNGQGAAQRAISALYETEQTNPQAVQNAHVTGTKDSAGVVRDNLHVKTRYEDWALHLGLDDVADVLGPKVDGAIKKLDDLKD